MAGTVIAPLVIARDGEGAQVYLYRGSPFPDGMAEGELERLVADGLVVQEKPTDVDPQTEHDAKATAEDQLPDGDPTEEWNVRQIDAYAAARSIDLTDHAKKAEKLAAIAAAAKA